jgi:hypothetical protein
LVRGVVDQWGNHGSACSTKPAISAIGRRSIVFMRARVGVWVRHHLAIDAVRPHLQAEHRFDVLPGFCNALPGVLLECHGMTVVSRDFASDGLAHHLEQLID